jgi:hypothetical protein
MINGELARKRNNCIFFELLLKYKMLGYSIKFYY